MMETEGSFREEANHFSGLKLRGVCSTSLSPSHLSKRLIKY